MDEVEPNMAVVRRLEDAFINVTTPTSISWSRGLSNVTTQAPMT
jgi:hypothetical protein